MTPSKAPLPFLGTWRLTSCESTRPDLPHPTLGITTFTQKEDAIHYSNDGVWSDGQTVSVSAVLRMDGSWCPVTGSLVTDSLSFRRLDDVSFKAEMRKGGVAVGTNHTTVSADGQTMTGHWEFPGPGGASINWTTTSQRQ
jgi:hypothetical protein